MKKLIIIILLTSPFLATAQNTFKAIVKDEKTKEAITNVSVLIEGTQSGSTTDEKGFVKLKIFQMENKPLFLIPLVIAKKRKLLYSLKMIPLKYF